MTGSSLMNSQALSQLGFARYSFTFHPHIATILPHSSNFAQTSPPELGFGSHCSLCKALSLYL